MSQVSASQHSQLWIVGDIDSSTEESRTRMEGWLAALVQAAETPSTHLTIYLMSGGGDVDIALAMYDLIASMSERVTCIGIGEVASAATCVFQAAGRRLMLPHSYLMIHEGTEGYTDNTVSNIRRQHRWNEEVEEKFWKIYWNKIRVKKPTLTYKEMRLVLRDDRFMDPHEAVKWGLADKQISTLPTRKGKRV